MRCSRFFLSGLLALNLKLIVDRLRESLNLRATIAE